MWRSNAVMYVTVVYIINKWSSKNHGHFSKSSTFCRRHKHDHYKPWSYGIHQVLKYKQYKNRWFKSNSLSLNDDKTHFLQFYMRPNQNYDFIPYYEDKQNTKVKTIKFLGITLDSNLSWKQHIEDITPRLNKACFAIRSIKPFMSVEAMRPVYFSYFHSILSYGIIFWENSVHSKYIFKIQKRTNRVITDSGMIDSCRELFKKLQILPLSLLMFVVKNRELFKWNSDIHHIGPMW